MNNGGGGGPALAIAVGRSHAHPLPTASPRLATGASGIVYSAIDSRNGRKVALKIGSINDLAELANEIGMQSECKHPNIVECIEAYAFQQVPDLM